VSFECRVDGGTWTTCTSPFTTAALGDGAHTFEVRATDSHGNPDATPASRGFTVDTTPPDTTITSGPAASSTETTPSFAFVGTGGATSFQCRMDGGAWTACATPFTTTVALGAHTFEVRAIDSVGNIDASPAAATFTVTAPVPPVPTFSCGGKTATIVGTSGADVLAGTAGNDVIVGLGGNDKINGGAGHDLICGGDGNDTIQGAGGKDVVDGGGGNDKLFGGGGADQIDGGAGRDRMQGNGGDDELVGGGGDDELAGDAGDDVLVGSGGNDVLAGGGGDDDLSGGAGDDHLNGGAGRDKGVGGGGNDVIVKCET
jgi:Ca2+-binding RTX toxin-like protein